MGILMTALSATSAVSTLRWGEYVNLWDYLTPGQPGTHTLTFFYTERGASGSTRYMNFTPALCDR